MEKKFLRFLENQRDPLALARWLSWLKPVSHTPKGCRFNSWLGLGHIQEVASRCFSLIPLSLPPPSVSASVSPSLSLPLSLKSINIYSSKDKKNSSGCGQNNEGPGSVPRWQNGLPELLFIKCWTHHRIQRLFCSIHNAEGNELGSTEQVFLPW